MRGSSTHPRRAAGLAGLLLALTLTGLAHAQTSPPPAPAPAAPAVRLPEPLTREAVRELVSRLSDTEVRQLLLAQLDRTAAASAPAPGADAPLMGMVTGMEGHADSVRARARAIGHGLFTLPSALGAARARFLEGRGTGHLAVALLALAFVLAVGALVEAGVRRALRGPRAALEANGAANGELARAGVRLVLDCLALAAFAVAAVTAFFAGYHGHIPTRRLVMTVLVAVVGVRLVALISRAVLAPGHPERRLVPFGEAGAGHLHRGLVRLTGLYFFGLGVLRLLQGLGVPVETTLALGVVLGALFLAVALFTVWGLRSDLTRLVRGSHPDVRPVRRLLADLAPALIGAYLVAVYLVRLWDTLTGVPPSSAPILSVALLVALPLADLALGRALGRLLAPRPDAAPAGDPRPGRGAFEPVLRRAIHVVVVVVGLLILAGLWDVDLFSLAERGLGGRISGALLGIAVTVLVAWILWQLVRTAIDQRLQAESGAIGGTPGEEGGLAASRLRTLLPLLRLTLLGIILITATLSVLAALGVNILPLMAGAGVFGLAIGFGSQTLVKDIVSGAFFLVDDAFRLGEYIEAGDSKGTVEKITIRSLHIRHHRGALNIVPYGEIKRLRNTSRDWMIMTLEFRLTYDTDLVKVKKILKRIGEELAADPELGRDLIAPLKSQGVMATEDSALLVRAKFMARPGSGPYLIRREAYSRIIREFAAQGIRFANRQVTVVMPPDGEGGPTAGAVAASAAAAAAALSTATPGPA
jgi:small-conductance mechanosensitive channel